MKWLFMGVIALFIGLIALAIVSSVQEDEFGQKCESLGGVYLKNSRLVGKVRKTSYVCLKKESVIEF